MSSIIKQTLRELNRRDFIKSAAWGAALSGCSVSRVNTTKKRKPNLLFLWTDEQRADTMAAYANRKIHTPNLNRLSAQSVVFEKAYVTQPVCTPSRSSVMTGLWPHTTGCIKNNVPLPLDIPCFVELLNDPDYCTAYMGKWHLGDELYRQHSFDEWVSIEDVYNKHFRPGRDRSKRSDYHHFLLEKGYQPGSHNRFSRSFAARLPIEQCKPKFLELKACDFLHRHQHEPFMLYVNFLEPHMPFFGPLDNEHAPAKVTLPSNFNDPLEENEPLRYRVSREACMEKYGREEKDIRALIARYWGLVTQVDRSVGAILQTLDDLGLADDTIVVYTSDHGDMMGAHRLVTKSVMYEEAVKVPWLMRIPQMQSRVLKNPVSHIDMVPTLLELMGKNPADSLPGQSLIPLMQGGNVKQDHVFIQWNPDSGSLKVKSDGTSLACQEELQRVKKEHSRAIISPDGWKLSLSDADKCQLFNLKDDPGETTNLFDSARHQHIIRRLTKKIHNWQKSVQDKVNV